jgi:hypothetical protein
MNDVKAKSSPSIPKLLAMWVTVIFFMLVLFELLSAPALLYYYRTNIIDSGELLDEVSNFSSVNILYKTTKRLGLNASIFPGAYYQRYDKEVNPEPFFRADPVLGYSAAPGVYEHSYLMRQGPEAPLRTLKVTNTINNDGSRWTGPSAPTEKSTAYVFGDSVIYGTGVHDEHTFSYLLRQARPDMSVKLFALGGYGLTQTYLRFEEIKDSITADDVIILGYADFYDARNVMSPSRLKSRRKWTTRMNKKHQERSFLLPRVSNADANGIEISYVQENCRMNDSYCAGADPSNAEMTNVAAAIVNHIASNTEAKVYLLHFNGDTNNPVFEQLSENITLISVVPESFDTFVKDDIEGFDPHPGPYWHHAVSRRILQVLPGS